MKQWTLLEVWGEDEAVYSFKGDKDSLAHRVKESVASYMDDRSFDRRDVSIIQPEGSAVEIWHVGFPDKTRATFYLIDMEKTEQLF